MLEPGLEEIWAVSFVGTYRWYKRDLRSRGPEWSTVPVFPILSWKSCVSGNSSVLENLKQFFTLRESQIVTLGKMLYLPEPQFAQLQNKANILCLRGSRSPCNNADNCTTSSSKQNGSLLPLLLLLPGRPGSQSASELLRCMHFSLPCPPRACRARDKSPDLSGVRRTVQDENVT